MFGPYTQEILLLVLLVGVLLVSFFVRHVLGRLGALEEEVRQLRERPGSGRGPWRI